MGHLLYRGCIWFVDDDALLDNSADDVWASYPHWDYIYHDGKVRFFEGVPEIDERGIIQRHVTANGEVEVRKRSGLAPHPRPKSAHFMVGDVLTKYCHHHGKPVGFDVDFADRGHIGDVHRSNAEAFDNVSSNNLAWRAKFGIVAATPTATGSL